METNIFFPSAEKTRARVQVPAAPEQPAVRELRAEVAIAVRKPDDPVGMGLSRRMTG